MSELETARMIVCNERNGYKARATAALLIARSYVAEKYRNYPHVNVKADLDAIDAVIKEGK